MLLNSQLSTAVESAPKGMAYSVTSKKLFGPEVFPFCGGWVEVFIRVAEDIGQRTSEFVLKATPPEGKQWTISNGNIVVENPTVPDEHMKFESLEKFEVKKGGINTHIWKLPWFLTDKYKVALLPVEGCSDQPHGLVLKEFQFK